MRNEGYLYYIVHTDIVITQSSLQNIIVSCFNDKKARQKSVENPRDKNEKLGNPDEFCQDGGKLSPTVDFRVDSDRGALLVAIRAGGAVGWPFEAVTGILGFVTDTLKDSVKTILDMVPEGAGEPEVIVFAADTVDAAVVTAFLLMS